jgi:hypothetical protein
MPRRLARPALPLLALASLLLAGPRPAGAEVLVTDRVAVGVNTDGSLCTDDASLGLLYDPDGPLGPEPVGGDLLLPGNPWEVWSAEWAVGGAARASVSGGPHLAGGPPVAWSGSGVTAAVSWLDGETTAGDLDVTVALDLAWDVDVLWITLTVTALDDLTDLWLARTVDADQDFVWDTYETVNDATAAGVVVADGPASGRALALAAAGGRAAICWSWCTLPRDVRAGFAGPETGDRVVGLAVEVGDLALGESAEVVFVYALADDADAARDLALLGAERRDRDGDGVAPPEDCDDRDPWVAPGVPERADGVDDDCDGAIDEGTSAADDDGDGASEAEGDCDDADPRVHPGAAPVEGVVDADCDGVADADGDAWPRDGGPPDGWGADDAGPDADADGDADVAADADGDGDADADADGHAGVDADAGGGADDDGCGSCAAGGTGPRRELASILRLVMGARGGWR